MAMKRRIRGPASRGISSANLTVHGDVGTHERDDGPMENDIGASSSSTTADNFTQQQVIGTMIPDTVVFEQLSSDAEMVSTEGEPPMETSVLHDGRAHVVSDMDVRTLVNGLDYKEFMLSNNDNALTFITVTKNLNPRIEKSVVFDINFTPHIHVFNKPVTADNEFWQNFPSNNFNSLADVQKLLNVLSSATICCGVDDRRLLTSSFMRNLSTICVDEVPGQPCQSRSKGCSLLVCGAKKCKSCCRLTRTLRMRFIRQKRTIPQMDITHSRMPNIYLSSPLKRAKLRQLALRTKVDNRRIASLKSNVEKYKEICANLIATRGEQLQNADNDEIMKLASDCKDSALQQFPSGSFQHIFFEQQMKFNSLKAKSSMRWHPSIIRWCLFIKSKSAKAYDGMRSFLNLPSNRTLYDYSHYMEHGVGMNPKTVEQLICEAEKLGCFNDLHKSYVGLLQDEIKIKSDLVYQKSTGELVGYVNLDNITNELLNLEEVNGTGKSLASSLLVVMVRGISTSLCYPLASYATKLLAGSMLYNILWESVECLEVVIGLRVLFICCDGAIQNRRFFQLHVSGSDTSYRTRNPYASDTRDIFFISDPPHLIKTARNCFASSSPKSTTRHMWLNGDISWTHVVRLYEEHCYASEYRMCPKLTRNHIELTSFAKMRVSLAAQVLSDTVANALELMYGESVAASVKFIRMMNKWFDIVNVKNLYEGRNSRNPNLQPFTDPTDARLDWLETEFVQYLDNWKETASNRPGSFTPKQRQQMQLSTQTLHGLFITSISIAAIVRLVLNAGAPFVLTSHLNQDPLEQLFGHCRHKGGSNDNPTIAESCHIINNIRTVNTQAIAGSRGNTRPISRSQILDVTPLPKRCQKR